MKKQWVMLLVALVLSLTGCNQHAASDPSSVKGDSSIVEEMEVDLETLKDALDSCAGWGQGSAGSSLSSLQAAVNFLGFASDNDVNKSAEIITDTVDTYLKALDDEQRTLWIDNVESIINDADGLIKGDKNKKAMLEDIGAEDFAEALGDDDLKAQWTALKDIINQIIEKK